MNIFNHQLSAETIDLINEVVRNNDIRLSIYAGNNWAVENNYSPGGFAFDPNTDSDYLKDQLRRIIRRGRV